MNKPLIAIAAATIALSTTALTSTAEAGFGLRVGLGVLHIAHLHVERHHCHRHIFAIRRERERVYVTRRVHTPVIASEEQTPAPETTAENENSSITTAALDPAVTADTATPVATETSTPPDTDTTADTSTDATTPAPATEETTPATPDANAAVTPAPVSTDTSAEAAPVTPAPQKVADVQSSDCKAFFPAVGITVSVPCQK